MKKLKRITDISKGLIAIVIIGAVTPIIVGALSWYCYHVFKMFF